MAKYFFLLSLSFLLSFDSLAQGWPGVTPNWSNAQKIQTGTRYNDDSSTVWFTNAKGVLTETYYPTIDQAQIKDAQLLITDGSSFMLEERTGLKHEVEVISPSQVKMINRDPQNRFVIEHLFYSLRGSSTIVDQVTITNNRSDLNYYLLVNSAMNNTGYGDSGKAHSDRLSFQEGKLKLHVSSSIGFHHTTMGYVGFTDGYQDLSSDYVLNGGLTNVTNGNIAGTGHLKVPPEVGTFTFYIIYHFGEPRQFAESKLRSHKKSYALEWQNYIDSLKRPAMSRADRRLYERSLYTLRVHADKKIRVP
jgi:glucoamylase